MKRKIIPAFTASILALLFSKCSFAERNALPLPSSQQWLKHVEQGLMPYWMMESAQGHPIGNFPTFRCDDGTVLDVTDICPELNADWISPNFGREYTRMKSRQTYAYGVIYHLTGNRQALELARKGAYYLVDNLQDKEHGGFVSFTKENKPGLNWRQRTVQDQAYALVGLAMYYYLTRDKKVEKTLIKQQAFIFDQYRLGDGTGLAWVLKDGDGQSTKQRELVAQLDQINAYLLLVAPLLPEPAKATWLKDLNWLTQQMMEHYHSAEESRFYGAIHHKAVMMQDARHNDFGHTIKAYWMTLLTSQVTGNEELKEFAVEGIQTTLSRASYQVEYSQVKDFFSNEFKLNWVGTDIVSWMSRPYNRWISSWEWAELDQAAMTVSLIDDSQTDKLQYTLPTYMDVWVDHKYGGVGLGPKSTKAFHWGNGYHQFEHALIGYLFASQYEGKPATLYYALDKPTDKALQPYYFSADILDIEPISLESQHSGQRVQYENISPIKKN
ncbi:AGE family epimerase/isomerase [Vibrio sp. HN007]|uniref:AGE family epimerase/isomerase n=1 Tax=Vibrio iocasae TaxID=3098914 RepID=UPI0035D4E68F